MRIVGGIWSAVIILVSAAAVGQSSAGSTDLPALNHFDASVVNHNLDPCVDFYKFVCSNWQAANPIPSDQVVWGTGSNLRLWNETVLRNTM
jgi:putative endopeptidase